MGGVLVRVPQQNAFVVEYFGKFHKIFEPGLHFLIPFAQRVRYRHSLKEKSEMINAQTAITKDNVYLSIDGVLYLQIDDPFKASYGAENPLEYTYTLAQSVMRSEIGKMDLDTTFRERDTLNEKILDVLSLATSEWGIKCLRYEIKDIQVGQSMKKILNLEAESERKKRADIKTSEGKMSSAINIAEGHKRAVILDAEAHAQQTLLAGSAIADRITKLGRAVASKEGEQAAKFNLAEMYIDSLRNLSDENKNLVIKANLNDPSEVIDRSLGMLDSNNSSLKSQ